MHNSKTVKVLFGIVLIFFAIFLFLPILMIGVETFRTDQGFSFQNIISVFGSIDFRISLRNSFLASSLTAITTVLLASILAYSIHATNLHPWIKKAITGLSILPMLLPTITFGFALLYFFGKQGILTRLIGHQLIEVYGLGGIIIGHVIYTLPIAFLLISNTLMYVDTQFILVSKLMGDRPIKTFFVTMVRPIVGALGAAFIQSFFLSFTDFGIPAAIGGNYKVIVTLLYNTMLGSIPDFGGGAVVGISMVIPAIISITLLGCLDRFNFRYEKVTKIRLNDNKLRDGIMGFLSFCILLFILAILSVLFILPFIRMWPYRLQFTLEHFFEVFKNQQLFYIYCNSVIIAVITGVIGTMIAYASAIITQRSQLKGGFKKVIDSIALITNALPGMVLGISYLFAFTNTSIQNTILIIVASNIVHYFSAPYLMIRNALSKMNSSWEITASLMGDNWFQSMIRIITPNAKVTLFEMFEYFFINGMVTISAVIFLTGARTTVITSKMKELQYMGKFDQIFVFSLMIMLTNFVFKIITHQLKKRRTS